MSDKKNAVTIHAPPKDDETPSQAVARAVLDPTTASAVLTGQLFDAKADTAYDIGDLVIELEAQCEAVNRGDLRSLEKTLVSQVHTLNQVFYESTHRAIRNRDAGYFDAFETYMKLAFRAQAQCRAAVDSIGELKSPRSVAFIRQANVAHNQQVNNGDPALARPRETAVSPNKLNGIGHEQSLDVSYSKATGRVDPTMEAVGTVNRTED